MPRWMSLLDRLAAAFVSEHQLPDGTSVLMAIDPGGLLGDPPLIVVASVAGERSSGVRHVPETSTDRRHLASVRSSVPAGGHTVTGVCMTQPQAVSNWPDQRPVGEGRPRSATVAITRDDGGVIGA